MTAPEAPAGNDTTGGRSSSARRASWAWPLSCVMVAALLTAAGVYVFKSCRDLPGETLEKTGKLAASVGQQIQQVASAFKQGTITTTFTSYATSISGSQYLQFATLSQQETFTRTDESSLLFGYIPLPDVIVEASAPVTYTYYLDLNARWDFELKDGVVYVTAPDIKFNKPALDISRMTYEVKKGSHLRNTEEAMENLRSSMTWMTYQKAKANIPLVRDTGRRQTESFVEHWLAKSFTDGKNYPVKVRFRTENVGFENGPSPRPDK